MNIIQPVKNFFDFADPRFFSVLARQNRRFYADCIVELYRYVTLMTSFCSQEDAITVLAAVESRYNGRLEQEDLLSDLEPAEAEQLREPLLESSGVPTPRYVYRRLRACGWIEEVYSSRRRQLTVFFTTVGDSIAARMLDTVSRADKVALGGYVRNIISDLEAVKTAAHPYSDGLRLAMEAAQNLMRDFRSVITEISSDIEALTRTSQDTDAGVQTFMQFNAKYAHGVLSRVQQDEYMSPADMARIAILLDDILDSAEQEDEGFFRRLTDNVQDSYGLAEDDAAQVVRTTIDAIRRILLEEYDELVSELAGGEADFLERAQRVVISQLGDRSFAARLLYCFSVLRVQLDSEAASPAFAALADGIGLPDVASLESDSLYRPKSAPRPFSAAYDTVEDIDLDALRAHEREHTLTRPFSIRKANEFADRLLDGRDEALSSEIDLSTLDGRRQYVNLYLCQDTGDQFRYRIETVADSAGEPVYLTAGGQKRPLYRIERRKPRV